jgi:RNA polymerase sigma factor (sigma-70 family)
MNWESLVALFRRMVAGDPEATKALADYLRLRGEQALAGNREAKDELETLVYRIVEERVRAMMEARERYLLDRGHSAASAVHEAWARLLTSPLPRLDDPKALCCLVVHLVRFAICDMAKKQREADRRYRLRSDQPDSEAGSGLPPADKVEDGIASDQQSLSMWSEFHERVAALPEDEQEVFRLGYYAGLSREAIARQLGITVHRVNVLWFKALCTLGDILPDEIG